MNSVEASLHRFGSFAPLEPLGGGGMGVVYRARDLRDGREVALKTVRLRSPAMSAGIRREIHALRRARHPGVVRILDEGVEEGSPWYAMELLQGVSLERYALASGISSSDAIKALRERSSGRFQESGEVTLTADILALKESSRAPEPPALPPRITCDPGKLAELLTIFCRLCQTLSFLHGEGLLHADLKPSNVFLLDELRPVLIDFGLAWRLYGTSVGGALEASSSLAGTPAYLAPELLVGDVIDARSDLYSVGAMLYECLVGAPPFGHGAEALSAKVVLDPVPMSQLAEGIPAALDELVAGLLRRRPGERLASAQDVSRTLEALGGEPFPGEPVRVKPYLYTPQLTGREALVRALESLEDEACAGRGALVLLGGESGVGKTHLLGELARRATPRGLRVVVGECQAQKSARGQGSGRPLHPLRGLFQAAFDLCAAQGDAMAELLGDQARILAPYFPELASLPGFRALPEPAPMPPQAARDRLFALLNRLVFALAARQPLLLILDDLQWADELTLGWLEACPLELGRGARLLLLGAYRSEEKSDQLAELERRPEVRGFRVQRLEPESIAAVAGHMLGCPPEAPFGALLAVLSEGNPFFVAEYLRVAVAEGLLARTPQGRWELSEAVREAGGYGALGLPRDLHALILRRLRALSPDTYRVAEIASVLGREADMLALEALSGLPAAEHMEALQELLARQIFEEHEAGRLRFVHDKIHENIYERIDPERRRQLHLRVARQIEQQHGETSRLPMLLPALAAHCELGGDVERAAEYLEQAATQALESFANREATEYFRRLLALAGRVSPELDRMASWHRGLGVACYRLGRMSDTIEQATRSLEILGYRLPETPGGWGLRTLRELGTQVLHQLPAGRRLAPRDERARVKEAALAMDLLTECWYFTGEMQTLAGGLASVNLAERSGYDLPRPYAALGGVAGLSNLGGAARRYFELSRRAARLRSDRIATIYSYDVEASWLIGVGEWARASELSEQAMALAEEIGERREFAIALALAGHVDYFRGRFEESLRRFEEVGRSARERGDEQLLPWGLCGSARALLALDRPDDARVLLEEALSCATTEIVSRIDAPGLLGAAYARLGRPGDALAMARATREAMASKPPVMFFMATEGIVYTAQTFLDALLDASPGERDERSREAREGLQPLALLSLNVAIARPALGRLASGLARAHGQRGLASLLRARGLAAARRLGMPREIALLEALR